MEKRKMSMLDAFVALDELDEDIQINTQAGKLAEGKAFDVRDAEQLKEAEEVIHEPKQELDLEVIDVDADTMNHLKDHKDYVGQMIMVCKACRTPHFMDPDQLEEDPDQEGVFNIETECPHCHQVGKGFECTTQVGAVAKEEPEVPAEPAPEEGSEEAAFSNDEFETSEPTVGNDFVPEEAPEEETAPEEAPVDNPYMPHDEYNFEDRSYDDTNVADDTADMEYKPGEDVNFDDVPWDDTEGEAPAQPEEKPMGDEEGDKPEFVTIDKKEESLEEDAEEEIDPEDDVEEEVLNISFVDFKNLMIDADKVQSFKMTDLDGDVLFDDSLEQNEVSPNYDNFEMIALDPRDSTVTMMVSEDEPDETSVLVGDILALLDDDVKVTLTDDDGNEFISGTPEEVLDREDNIVIAFEPLEAMEIIVKNPEAEEPEGDDETDDSSEEVVEESFISRLFKANNLKEYRINKFGTEEYFLNESLNLKEDLDEIRSRYVTEDLLVEFKEVTGYRDIDDYRSEAKRLLDNSGASAVIYGYTDKNGKSHSIEPKVCKSKQELDYGTESVQLRYHPTTVLVVYPDSTTNEKGFVIITGNRIWNGANETYILIDDEADSFPEEATFFGTEAAARADLRVAQAVAHRNDLEEPMLVKASCVDGVCRYTESLNEDAKPVEEVSKDEPAPEDREIENKSFQELVDDPNNPDVTTEPDGSQIITGDTMLKAFEQGIDVETGEVAKPGELDNATPIKVEEEIEEALNEDVKSDIVDPLVRDEEEAIDGYNKAKADLKSEENISVENKDKINQVFDHIAKEEQEHIEEIKDVTKEVVESFKDRRSLSAAVRECKNNKQPYTIRRSLKEGYRFDLIKEDIDDEPEQEVITPVENEVTTVEPEAETTAVVDPRDAELVDKLMRISQNIASEIESAYGVHADARAIMADIIQDLQLVSGQLTPAQIENTPMNQLTKEMYQAYNGFYDAMDEMVSFITGEEIHTTQAQKLQQALASLDGEQFSPQMIAQNTRSPEFLRALRTGNVPGIEYQGNANNIVLLDAPHENSGFHFDENLEEKYWFDIIKGNPDDYKDDLLDAEADKADEEKAIMDAEEKFVAECQNRINEWFDNEYEDTVLFVCESYFREGNDLIMIGDVESEDNSMPISFKVNESKQINESTGADETVFEIKNTVSEEVIKFNK